jgi:nucleoside-diphosphate-sugar epimerase
MKVLVSGASGFLGHYVVARLLERGHSVRAIVRPASPDPSWVGEVEVFRADLRVHENLVNAFDGIDALLHLAAVTSGDEDFQFASTVVATERLLDAMSRSPVKRLVHVSSFVVYDWARAKRVMDEETPLLRHMYKMGGYTIAKVWQERVVSRAAAANSWELTIMRPGFIWGPQHAVIGGMGRIFDRIYLMFGPFTRLPLTHVVNCANCLVAALERRASVGESFNVIDGDQIRVLRYVREYSRRTGRRGILLPIPYRLGFGVAYLASLVSRTLFGKKGQLPSLLMPRRFEQQFKPIRFSNRKLKDKLSWSPPLSFDECLSVTYGSPNLMAHPESGDGDSGRGACGDLHWHDRDRGERAK